MEWDDDGDRWGRDILALADGRFLVVWVVAGDRSEPSAGIHYNISAGKSTLCVSDETVLDPLFSTVSRPFRTVFRGLGAGFWNLGGKMEKMAKTRGKNDVKWARNGLKKVGPMTD